MEKHTPKGIRGQILTFTQDPFLAENAEECCEYHADGLIVINDGHIVAVGDYKTTIPMYPDIKYVDTYRDSIIMPGFIDSHVHYVQSPMIGSHGGTLLHWLNEYTFPTEAKFKDKDFAEETARMFFRQLLSQGTTTANVFSTTFTQSVDAFFEESERYNTRMISGKVLQDRNLPESLRDKDSEKSIIQTDDLLKKWHGKGRQLYAIIPRFAPTSSNEQLRLAGELYQRHIEDGVYMHTHLDEAESEIEWVKSLFPESKNYTDVYDSFGLVDRNSVFAHCCLVKEVEWQILHDNQCGIAHCPSSNLFLGDGEFKYWEAKNHKRPCRVGIGTDVGGGTSFSIPFQLNEAHKVAMLQMHSIDALHGFYLATRGGAETLHLEHVVGSLKPGYEADITVLDLKATEFVEWRMQFTNDIFQKLFVLQTIAPDNMIRATYVAGEKVYDRDRGDLFLYA